MSRDLTHEIRLAQLQADYARAGIEFEPGKLGIPRPAGGTADFTRAEVNRLLRDEDGRQAALQADTITQTEGR